MKSYRKELELETAERHAYINITPDVIKAVADSGITDGLVLVSSMHVTASVFINEDEAPLYADFENWLELLAPKKPCARYAMSQFDANTDSRLKQQIMGRGAVAAVTGGVLELGNWEQIIYGEFDGMRKKKVLIKIIGE